MIIRVLANRSPKIHFTVPAYAKMQAYVDQCTTEVGWLGDVTLDPETFTFTITDVFLVKQEVNGATCELKEEALNELYRKRIEKNIPTDTIMFWGHSHVNMSPSPSGQDETQLAELGANSPYFIRMILNKKGAYDLCLVDNSKGVIFDELDWAFEIPDMGTAAKAEIDKCVTTKTYTYGAGAYGGGAYGQGAYGGYGYGAQRTPYDWEKNKGGKGNTKWNGGGKKGKGKGGANKEEDPTADPFYYDPAPDHYWNGGTNSYD